MDIERIYTAQALTDLAKERFREERALNHLEGWFLAREIAMECDDTFRDDPDCIRITRTLKEVVSRIPLTLGDYHVFAGTQDDAFARSYALINPAFTVKSFAGYCDPVAVFGDIDPIGDITRERIDRVKDYYSRNDFARALTAAYKPVEKLTGEAVFFLEQVTGHVVPDVREYLRHGASGILSELEARRAQADPSKQVYYDAMRLSVEALLLLAKRYRDMAIEKAARSEGDARERFALMARTLEWVPERGARNLYEAIQSFLLIWQLMTLEQTPNPFAFSVGNADRIFEPYRAMEDTGRDMTAALLKHLLVFFKIGRAHV